MGTARMKLSNDSDEESKMIKVKMKRRRAGEKLKSPDGVTIARAYRPPGVATIE